MIDHCITQEEKSLLKSLIGTKLLCFKSEKKDSWNRIFGNISLVSENTETEIRNELVSTIYFAGETEDVSRFAVKKISKENPFKLMIVSDVFETAVNEKITDIILVTDAITVQDSGKNTIYEISTTESIVIKTDNSTFVLSRDWHLEEIMTFVITSDYKRDIYPIADVVSEWSDEEEGFVAICNRTEISLNDC
ncbi:MAG: hypothetical protein J5687_07675 [Treponema sp.]|nr:hypothetical protein [Treponema sp.]